MRLSIGSLVCACLVILATGRPVSLSLTVPAGGNLQQALNAARPGDTILLEAGALYTGNFVLPPRFGEDTRPIVIRTDGRDPIGKGERISPAAAVLLAKIQSPDSQPALRTSPATRFWRIELVEFLANRGGQGDIIALGDGSSAQKTLADVPSDIVLDRVYIHGDPMTGQKRAIALNSARTTISNSHIASIMAVGQDAQAIGGWNGPGDYLIENNFIEAAAENIGFGGTDPAIPNLVPTGIVIRRNTVSKSPSWRAPGARWQVKNLFELKNARNVIVEQNVFERNWQSAQSGFAILLTVRNQDGGCPWCQISNVQFRYNIVRDVAAGVSILGFDSNHPSRQTTGIVFRDNLFDGIDSRTWGGNGYVMQLLDRPRDITFDHNTFIQGGSGGVAAIDGTVEGFAFTNNIASHGAYGFIAANRGVGNDSIGATLPGSRITSNVLAGGNAGVYPRGNLFPSLEEFRRQFVDFDGRDFRLLPTSPWLRAGSDGRGLGADLSAVAFPRIPNRRPWVP